jgi:hypothetical protein
MKDEITVYVKSSNIVAVIDGGKEQIIAINKYLSIDGSNSYDENYDRSPIIFSRSSYSSSSSSSSTYVGKDIGLSYEWNCNQVNPFINNQCGLQILSTLQSDNILLHASEESIGYKYRISLSVYSNSRSSSTYIDVLVVDDKCPLISVAKMNGIKHHIQ